MKLQAIRSSISAALAYPLLKFHQKGIARGRLTAVPLFVWHTLPGPMRNWFDRCVLKPGEEFAWQEIRANPALAPVSQNTNNGWSLSPSSRLFLWKVISERRPRRLIDFGTGQSTLLFALYAARMAESGIDVRVCSIEHDSGWVGKLTRTLRDQGLDRFVTLVEAPLSAQTLLGREMTAYTVSADVLRQVAGEEGFDLCLIDGPPGGVGRSGSLAIAAPHLASESTILLDDAYRDGERRVIAEWRRAWPRELGRPRLLMADGHGIAELKWQSR